MGLQGDFVIGERNYNYAKIIGLYPNTTYSQTVIKLGLFQSKKVADLYPSNYVPHLFGIAGTGHTTESAYDMLRTQPEFASTEITQD
jgi:hypothetical protein